MSFELWHEGTKVSKENSIKVEWQPSPPPAPNEPVDADLSMSSLAAMNFAGANQKVMNGPVVSMARIGVHP